MSTAQAMPPTALGAYACMDPEAAPLWPAGAEAASAYGAKLSIPQKRRRSWNSTSLFVAVGLPWGIFVAVFAVMSFPLPRSLDWSSYIGAAQLSFAICCVCLLIVLALGYAASRAWRKARLHGAQELTWYTLIFASALIAWLAGMVLGHVNYTRTMGPWTKLSHAATYKAVDPAGMSGATVADAGRVFFEAGSHVDTRLAMSYKETTHTYCIAPFVMNETAPNPAYDFWTVGLDCCHHIATDDVVFLCNHDYSPEKVERMKVVHSFSGVRWLNDEGGFRHALEQAEVRYNITVTDPIFLVSTEDADAAVASYQDQGIHNYLEGMLVFLACQVALVACGVVVLIGLGW